MSGFPIDSSCCCGECTASTVGAASIGSIRGLITDPDCGLKPNICDELILSQRAVPYEGVGTTCCLTMPEWEPGSIPNHPCCCVENDTCAWPPGHCLLEVIGGSSEGRAPFHIKYAMDASLSPGETAGSRYIWYSRIFSLNLDPFVPSSNTCKCAAPATDFCISHAHLECGTDTGILTSTYDLNTGCRPEICLDQGIVHYHWTVGRNHPIEYFYDIALRRKVGSTISPHYPASTIDEVYPDTPAGSNAGIQWDLDNPVYNIAGFTSYQMRVAKEMFPWAWEIAAFNDSNPVRVEVNVGGIWETDTKIYLSRGDPTYATQDPVPLMLYLAGWVGVETAYSRDNGSVPTIPWLPASNNMFSKTTPMQFCFRHDLVPMFTFAYEYETPGEAAGIADWIYPGKDIDVNALLLSVEDVRSDLRLMEGTGALDSKDWRGEVLEDLLILKQWYLDYTASQGGIVWGALTSLFATLFSDASNPQAAELKPIGPVRLRGDKYRVSDAAESNPDFPTLRPPALARADLVVPSDLTRMNEHQRTAHVGSVRVWTPDNYLSSLQVDPLIYQLPRSSTGGEEDSYIPDRNGTTDIDIVAEDAYLRLVQSIYFRTMPHPKNWTFVSSGVFTGNISRERAARDLWFWDVSTGSVNAGEVLKWSQISGSVCAGTIQPPNPPDWAWCTSGAPVETNPSIILDNRCTCWVGLSCTNCGDAGLTNANPFSLLMPEVDFTPAPLFSDTLLGIPTFRLLGEDQTGTTGGGTGHSGSGGTGPGAIYGVCCTGSGCIQLSADFDGIDCADGGGIPTNAWTSCSDHYACNTDCLAICPNVSCLSCPFICAQCDCFASHSNYLGNPHVFVGRCCFRHKRDNTPANCCMPHNGFNGPTNNYCWIRHKNRPFAWDTSTVPFKMVPVSVNLLDKNDYGCGIPPVHQWSGSHAFYCTYTPDGGGGGGGGPGGGMSLLGDGPDDPAAENYGCCANAPCSEADGRGIAYSWEYITGTPDCYSGTQYQYVNLPGADPNTPYGFFSDCPWHIHAMKIPPAGQDS